MDTLELYYVEMHIFIHLIYHYTTRIHCRELKVRARWEQQMAQEKAAYELKLKRDAEKAIELLLVRITRWPWISVWDDNSSAYYFIHAVTRETVWVRPIYTLREWRASIKIEVSPIPYFLYIILHYVHAYNVLIC